MAKARKGEAIVAIELGSFRELAFDELRAFEREYRTRLKAYLESQLRDLDGRGAAIESESGRAAGAGSFVTSSNSARVDNGRS